MLCPVRYWVLRICIFCAFGSSRSCLVQPRCLSGLPRAGTLKLWLASRADRRSIAVLLCPGQKIFSFPLNRVIDGGFRLGKLKALLGDS